MDSLDQLDHHMIHEECEWYNGNYVKMLSSEKQLDAGPAYAAPQLALPA